jgi:hypothetical protein
LEIRLAAEEKRALSDLEKQFEEKVQAEEKIFRESQRSLARVQLDETMREVERMEREHKMRLEAMGEDLLREGERYKQSLNAKVRHLTSLQILRHLNSSCRCSSSCSCCSSSSCCCCWWWSDEEGAGDAGKEYSRD